MKRKIRIQILTVMLLIAASFNSFSQDKYGGLTLYTVRSEMGTNPEKTLDEVADIGYKYIESAGYQDGKFYNMTPEDFKNYLAGLGLVPLSTHQGTVTLENADDMIADVKAAGFKYFVIPVPPMGHFKYDPKTQSLSMTDDLGLIADILTTLGKKCKEAGLELLYHNHNFEFEKNKNGIVPIEYFLENLDPEYVNFQIDLYWAVKAGADPVAYFEKYPGRFKIWHVKDMDDQGRFAPVGMGNIEFARILEKKEVSGMKYYIVEQDRTFDGMTPLESIKISHEELKKIGFK